MNPQIEKYNMTCVSGFWKVDNKNGNKYKDWFKNSLKINCPYVFFSDKETIDIEEHQNEISNTI
jgi:hypothetical protein